VVLGLTAPSALAGQSTNWAGYAVHRPGVSFNRVQGTWREPQLTCTPGRETFSSYWVGIGGYRLRSHALEQVGTEVDCTSAGTVRATAWYELIPAPSIPVSLKVPPGDLIKGSVSVHGSRVRVSLRDLTANRGFSRTLHAPVVDVSSAEWIVEAPSDCRSTNTCVTLPLGDFGTTMFTGARARSSSGHVGTIAYHGWGVSRINLIPRGHASRLGRHRLGRAGEATTSPLRAGGSAFTVSYVGGATSLNGADAGPGQLRHPAR